MTIKHPAGSGASPIISKPFKAKSAKNGAVKAPRRKTEAGGNSQSAVSAPSKQSPLRTLLVICRSNGYKSAYLKFPCNCENWNNRCANAVVAYRGLDHHIWCICEVSKMSEAEMLEVAA